MSIQITDKAASKVIEHMQARGTGMGIRIGVKTTGCSGYAYVLEFADEADEFDTVIEQHGATIVIDHKSLPLLNGIQIDYVRTGLNEGFEFSNPNSKGECGCGESFTV